MAPGRGRQLINGASETIERRGANGSAGRSTAPTIRDIAARAGVAISTVHYALQGTRPIKDSTRRRVLEAVRSLDYHPHTGAATLPSGRTRRLAVVIAGIHRAFANTYFSDFIRGLAAAAEEAGHSIVLYTAYERRTAEGWRPIHVLRRREADALVLMGTQLDSSHLDELAERGAPCVVLNREHAHLPSIVPDRRQGTALATGHLLRLGRHPVALIAASYPGGAPVEERPEWLGYADALAAAGLACDPSLVQFIPVAAEGGLAGEALVGRLAAARSSGASPGLVLFSYTLAPAACRAVARAGVRVPEDLGLVVGDEDVDVSESLDVPLTIVRAPKFAMAQAAVRTLLRALEDGALAPEERLQRFPMTLHVRWSCGTRRRS